MVPELSEYLSMPYRELNELPDEVLEELVRDAKASSMWFIVAIVQAIMEHRIAQEKASLEPGFSYEQPGDSAFDGFDDNALKKWYDREWLDGKRVTAETIHGVLERRRFKRLKENRK